MFGHSFSPEHIYSIIGHKQRDALLSAVPRPTRRALSRLAKGAAKKRKAAAPGGQGTKADFAQHGQHLESKLAEVAIMLTTKERRKELNTWLAAENLNWPSIRARRTGWMWAPESVAVRYINGGEAAVALGVVQGEARRLSNAYATANGSA